MDKLKIGNEGNELEYQYLELNENKTNPKNILDFNITNNNNLNDIEILKEDDLKKIILDLEKEINNEKNKSKDKTEENKNIFSEIKQKILDCKKEIKYYSLQNEKQREELELISKQVTKMLNNININNVLKNKDNSKKSQKDELIEKIDQKEKQLKSIMGLIKINENENESLKYRINKLNKIKNYDDLIKEKKEQENKIIELQKEIRIKKVQLEDHSKCNLIKSNLIKQCDEIKNEIKMYKDFYENSVNTINILENKNKPKIIPNRKKNSVFNSRDNKSLNIKFYIVNSDNKIDKEIYKLKYVKNKYQSEKVINTEKDEDSIDIPYNLYNIFNEKELKAIYIGLDKDKSKYINILKTLNIKSKYLDNIEAKHKFDIKSKLNQIIDLDEKIEHMNIKKVENDTDIKLHTKLIKDLTEEKKLYLMKNNKLNNQIKEKKLLIEKKDKEINILGNQLIQLKALVKKGNKKKIKNVPEIEIEYFDKNEENSIFEKILNEI